MKLVAKNVKVNKKYFVLTFNQDYIGINRSLCMSKKKNTQKNKATFVFFTSDFSVKMNHI